MQRFVYVMAKDYHTDDDVKDPPSPGNQPHGFGKAQQFNQSAPQF